jgi:hypothetical protein
MITPAQHAEIRRLFYAEDWRIGTIATQLGVHHETAVAALNRASMLTHGGRCRSTSLDPFLPFLRDCWRSTRGCGRHACTRCCGSVAIPAPRCRSVAPCVGCAPRRRARPTCASRRCLARSRRWTGGSFGTLRIGRGVRPLSAFVMVLGYSRAIHAVFTLDQTLESFLHGHVEAFAALGGSARTVARGPARPAESPRRAEPHRPAPCPGVVTMPSAPTAPATLSSYLRCLGLTRLATDLNDLLARGSGASNRSRTSSGTGRRRSIARSSSACSGSISPSPRPRM